MEFNLLVQRSVRVLMDEGNAPQVDSIAVTSGHKAARGLEHLLAKDLLSHGRS